MKQYFTQGQPILEEISKDCEYIFRWETNVVCPQGTKSPSSGCTFTDSRTGHVYDLSPLKKQESEHKSYKVRYKND